jgi:hypothetical protein
MHRSLRGSAIARRGRFRLVLSGGSTPRDLYARLAAPPLAARVDWQHVELFWGDERCVPPEHPDSNYRMVREALLGRVNLDPARVHRMHGEDEPAQAAAAYEHRGSKELILDRPQPRIRDRRASDRSSRSWPIRATPGASPFDAPMTPRRGRQPQSPQLGASQCPKLWQSIRV